LGSAESKPTSREEKILSIPDSSFEPQMHEHESDVLVIGGGVAGCLAALGAKESGAEVILAEKYNIYSSGDAGTGEDHFLAILGTDEWDNSKEFYRTYISGGRNIPNESHELIRRFAEELPEMSRLVEKMGMPFRDEKSGKYYRVEAFGEGHPYTIQFDGSNFKRIIASKVHDNKIHVLNRTMITNIFVKDGRVIGATGMNTGDGSFHIFNAKTVVMSTGEGCRLFRSTSGHPYDSWHSPYNTGDGIAMAFNAGAEMANLEFHALTMCAKGYSTPGTHAFFGMGCYLINARGERFMTRYHPLGERAERAFLTWGIYSEMRAGRGPCYVDCRHLSKQDLDRLIETLVVDKGPFGDFLRQKGIDLRTEPMEVSVSEFHSQSGILIGPGCETTVEGLFAAGEGTGSTAVSRVAVEGYRAGKNAAKLAHGLSITGIGKEQLSDERTRVYAPLKKETHTMNSAEFEQKIRDVMSDYAGFERTEESMKRALLFLRELEPLVDKLCASNFHELMRALESQNIFTVARLVVIAALQRKETRYGGNLIAPRGDYKEADSNWANRMVVLKKGTADREIVTEVRESDTLEEKMATA
jgi:adenylylsulfate reductase, subunit A